MSGIELDGQVSPIPSVVPPSSTSYLLHSPPPFFHGKADPLHSYGYISHTGTQEFLSIWAGELTFIAGITNVGELLYGLQEMLGLSLDLAAVLVAFTFRGMTDITTCVAPCPSLSPPPSSSPPPFLFIDPMPAQPQDVDRPHRLANERPANAPLRPSSWSFLSRLAHEMFVLFASNGRNRADSRHRRD